MFRFGFGFELFEEDAEASASWESDMGWMARGLLVTDDPRGLS